MYCHRKVPRIKSILRLQMAGYSIYFRMVAYLKKILYIHTIYTNARSIVLHKIPIRYIYQNMMYISYISTKPILYIQGPCVCILKQNHIQRNRTPQSMPPRYKIQRPKDMVWPVKLPDKFGEGFLITEKSEKFCEIHF